VKLTRAQRSKLSAGEPAQITGTGKCPYPKFYTHRVTTKIDLKVVGHTTGRSTNDKGEPVLTWTLLYELHDRRDPTRLLRRTPPVSHPSRKDFDEFGYPLPQTASDASDASSYTAGGSVVSDAGEAVPRGIQDAFTEQAKLEGHQANVARRLQYEQRHVLTRLAHLLAEADRLGIDPGRDVARIEAGVAKLERTVTRAGQQRKAA
jgi:hypothetical protein